uniref:Small nuclear RNA activating complex polypeptide 4 n=1 Tax=Seriola dumerili TaxID=41447 RepID=A0A3B4V7P6_SERDU
MNLVYQQVVQETLDQLEKLLTHNHRQQKELVSQLSGPIKEPSREQPAPSSYQQPITMYLGRFLKPYFKDKLTGLGPPANQETKEKASRMTGCLDDRKLKMKRWESWQKTLLIHSVTRDSLRRQIQPKLSKVDYLSQKLSSAGETDRQQLREQIDSLERDIDLLRRRKEEELIGDRYEEHDWPKISNIDFEGTREAEDIRRFWQNFLHPSISKTPWSQEEVQQLKEVSRRHGERHWETIAQELGTGRTAFMCLQTFQRFVSDSLRRSSWTPAEDDLLRELVDKMRIGNFVPYTQMSYFMEGRDPAQLIYRWNQVLDPSLKKGLWSKEEDELLLQAVFRHRAKNWWKIRLEVPGRTDSACRDRYYDCLKAGTKRGAFDKQERELLLQLVDKHGVGRWAKIAAEIPHRYDAQCLREWRKLSRPRPPAAQKTKRAKKPQRRRAKKKGSPVRRRIRRKLMKIKEEESSEEEREELVVPYMDSDEEEEKKKKKKVKRVEVKEKEKEYILPPIQDWIPAETAQQVNFLSFRPVVLPSSGDTPSGELVRSTILGQFGRSVIVGPNPRELQWEERHSSSTMMMVSADQLRAHLCRQVNKSNDQSCRSRGKRQTGRKNHAGRVTDTALNYELQAAVVPWIGNLLIPSKTRLTAADTLRERGEKTRLPSTPIFLLLLQTMNVDTVGCKDMIEQRRNRVVLLTPHANPPAVRMKDPRTIAGMLQQRRLMTEQLMELAPPTSLSTNQHSPAAFHSDHDYSFFNPSPTPKQPSDPALDMPLKVQCRRRKRGRGEEQDGVTSSQGDQCAGTTGDPWGGACTSMTGDPVGGARTGEIQEGKRVRKLSQKARALQEAEAEAKKKTKRRTSSPRTESKAVAQKKTKRRTSSSPCKKRHCASRCKQEVVQVDSQPPGLCLLPGQSMWVMTPGGLVQLAEAPPQGLQLVLVPGPPHLHPPPPGNILSCPVAMPPLQLIPAPGLSQPLPLLPPPTCPSKTLPPTFVLQPVPYPDSSPLLSCPPQHPPKLFLPYKGTVRVDPAEPPPLRREELQFDPSLMSLEPPPAVRDWLSGRGGVVVPGVGVALPYLPPFVSSLSTLSALLRAKRSLTSSSLELLSRGSEPRLQQTRPQPDGGTETSSSPPPDLPDSTSDLRAAGDPPAPSVSSDLLQEKEEEEQEEEEAEFVMAVRQLVTERFSGNPAYQLLKARFLSCFTVPALLATIQPIKEKTVARPASQEEEEEEEDEEEAEAELKKIKERGRQRRAERSLLLCDGSGAPANHFSGINTSTPPPDQTRPDR